MTIKKKRNLGKKIAVGFAVLLLVLVCSFMIYTSDYYHAEDAEIEATIMNCGIDISNKDGAIVFNPGNADTALIFYPGGKVEYTAYEPLMIKIAQKGILCILPKMPFNLAVFHINAAELYISDYSEIEQWYVGGHSLGGSMAASYASKNSNKLKGLLLLASYSTTDLSSSGLKVMSIYGSKDGVLNKGSYKDNQRNLPENYLELVIQGGNHAGFGNYGLQKGDGNADITSDQQQEGTAQAFAEFCSMAAEDETDQKD